MTHRVFISHSSHDKPAVEQLATALSAHPGLDPWFDKWEMSTGHDFVTRINSGLDTSTAGLIVFSEHADASIWVQAELSYLIYAALSENKPLIPVSINENAYIPPLLRPFLRRNITEVGAIADAILNRTPTKPIAKNPGWGKVKPVLISLKKDPANNEIHVTVSIAGLEHARTTNPAIPAAVIQALDVFHRGHTSATLRSSVAADRKSAEAQLNSLGHALAAFCLPSPSAAALESLINGCPIGTTVEITVETSGSSDLLALPFEALRLPQSGQLLATRPAVAMLRRPAGLIPQPHTHAPLPGPLKILVAVAAPDEGKTTGVVLNHEHELQTILDSLEKARTQENADIRVLEVGHPNVIGDALKADAYHVLHISCHGSRGQLEMENEDGEAVSVTAAQLLEPLRAAGNPLPLIFLSSCHGGTHTQTASSLAEDLLRGGIPAVLAMQTAVTDAYAIELAGAFYLNLSRRETLLPSRALADARRHVELAHAAITGPAAKPPPEYATATLFVATEDRPLANFAAPRQPLKQPPVYQVSGQVPQLKLGDLIGRRQELRAALRTLRSGPSAAGVVLTGIGGVGKSALAGRLMQRLSEDGWFLASHVGRWNLSSIAVAIGSELQQSSRPQTVRMGQLLTDPQTEDRVLLAVVTKALAQEKVLLVLDDFEQNLLPGGAEFHNSTIGDYLAALASQARTGKLLVTCRYPVPGIDVETLPRIPIGPLSTAQVRKLLLRLDGLKALDAADIEAILRVIGGHPRMLEFLDALLRGGQINDALLRGSPINDALLRGGKGRLKEVTQKLQSLAKQCGIDISKPCTPAEAVAQTIALGARDIFLDELMAIVRSPANQPNQVEEVLLQAAVSNLPLTVAGLAHMLSDGATKVPSPAIERALITLEDLSLLFRHPEDRTVWVHRWTAEGLAIASNPAEHRNRANRAGRYRWWRVKNESHSLEDAIEAVRNHLTGHDFDSVAGITESCITALQRTRQSLGVATLASEVLERLPEDHAGFSPIADEEAQAYLALGFTGKAVARYQSLLQRQQQLAEAEPARADYQRDLSVSYERMGDLYRDLGQGEDARRAFLQSLAIRQKLADAEPARADFQRDLSVSYERLGDLSADEDQPESAAKHYRQSLQIWETLIAREPDWADLRRGSVIPLLRLARIDKTRAAEYFLRAFKTLDELQKCGRLNPVDQPLLDQLRQVMAQMTEASEEQGRSTGA